MRIDIKPLSVNKAWKGRRYKTDAYNQYERDLLLLLPKIEIGNPPYRFHIVFGFSNKGSDIDNPLKPLLDIMQKKYKFNDSQIYSLFVHKEIVPKGKEYIDISLI